MKNISFKKLFSCFISLALIFCVLSKFECKVHANKFSGTISRMINKNSETSDESFSEETENENEFNFIKSNTTDNNFFYNGNWLLYGGIILIILSIIGMVITLKPKKRNKKNKRNRR